MDTPKDTIRFAQIFSARLVLEVFGGGGAIWGFSEVITFRNPKTQESWRFNAQVAGLIFFIRFLLQISDYLKKQSRDNDASVGRLFQIFSARLVLEVFGGAGAIWYVILYVVLCFYIVDDSTVALLLIFRKLFNQTSHQHHTGGSRKLALCVTMKPMNSGDMLLALLELSSSPDTACKSMIT